MATISEKERIQFELTSTEQLLARVKDHPVMGRSLSVKAEYLKQQLLELNDTHSVPKAILYFFGDPVKGSLGIDVDFLSATLSPFQKLVTAKVSTRWHGHVKVKGQMKSADDAKLFLTALPRGSFGVELTKLTNNHLYQDGVLTEALVDTINLINSAKSEDEFIGNLGSVQQRELSALRQFFKVLSKNNAGVNLETGDIRSTLTTEDVKTAYENVSNTKTDIDTITIDGRLRGILLETWQFDFLDDQEKVYHGALHSDVSEDQAQEYLRAFIDRPVRAHIEVVKIRMQNSESKESYKLKYIEDIQ